MRVVVHRRLVGGANLLAQRPDEPGATEKRVQDPRRGEEERETLGQAGGTSRSQCSTALHNVDDRNSRDLY